ncbi:linker between RRM2 and RRM3 domains in RBM39 protein [Phytophthora infestans]|uniref:Linker between RRM2 and RRM3 domains in RBM39 protein n=2 Tax=Phytophthora infestans TaxID=4787 RepID=A0A8S9UY20_PHYIN|nr:linker between RRM2 and RRM3 domains in RBM39 protein [Phytophthora infestans]
MEPNELHFQRPSSDRKRVDIAVVMADEDIDSLLQEGIQAAAKSKEDDEDAKNDRPEEDSRRSSRRRSRTRSRSHSRRRHRNRSRSRSRSPRRSRRSRRSRSRSPRRSRGSSRRDKGRSRSRSRERSSRKKRKSKSRSRSAPKEERERSTSAERAERAKQRELMELTRDHRTVFVGQLTQKVREKDLERFLTKTGKVENVLLIRDKFTNRSKGFAYVELSNLEDVPKVLLLNGQVPDFQVFPIMIKVSEAEKNFAAKKDSVMNGTAASGGPLSADGSGAGLAGAISGGGMSASALSAASRIYCGNLHTNITEDDLRIVFQSFGEVLSVTINRDEMGRSKGFSFIQFSSPQEANFALSKGNGLELAGSFLRLGPVNENAVGNRTGVSNVDNNATGGRWNLEDEEGEGLSMNAQSRSALMAKLAGNDVNLFPSMSGVGGYTASTAAYTNSMAATAAQRAEQATALMSSSEIEGSESFCFVVKNMFDVYQEQKSGNPEWGVEIQQDVEEECGQYGSVLHTYVEKEKQGGLVYVLFGTVEAAVSAAKKLHGRWFNKRQISVRYLSSQEYVGMFPEARSAVQTARASQ